MSELILSSEEKALAWADAPDELIANITRKVLVTAKQVQQTEGDTDTMLAAVGAISLIRLAVDHNAGLLTYSITHAEDGDGYLGDFKITVERIPKDENNAQTDQKETNS